MSKETYEDEFTEYIKKLGFQSIVCKGKNCGKEFKMNTLSKHLNHPAVLCDKFYTPEEIHNLKSYSHARWKKLINGRLA